MNGINLDEGTLAGADIGALTAQLAEANAAAAAPTETTASATTEQRAAPAESKVEASPTQAEGESVAAGKPVEGSGATTEAATPKPDAPKTEGAEAAKATEQPKPGEAKSKFTQEQERRDRSWKALNSEKEAFKAEKEATAKAKAELEAERKQMQAEREAAILESTPKPEQFEAAAQRKQTDADALEKQADRAEDAGDDDQARQLRAKAQRARVEAEQYREAGEQARKNPPPTLAAIQERRAAEEKEWTLKAAIDFPEFAKPNSAVAKSAVQFLENLKATDPVLSRHPKAAYFAAEHAHLQVMASAAVNLKKQLDTRDAELGQLRAKVKELEALTAPSGGGSVQQQPGERTFNEMSPSEQEQQLQQAAAELGSFR